MIKVFIVVINRGASEEIDSVYRFRNQANSRKFEILGTESVQGVNIVTKELE